MDKKPTPTQPSTFDQVVALYQQAVALYQQGKLQEALGVARRGLAMRPGEPELLNVAGVVAHRLGLLADAERYWRAAIEARADFAEVHSNLGSLLNTTGRFAEAEAVFRKTLAIRPQHITALYNLGNLLKARGRLSEAEAAYRQVLVIQPRHADAQNNLGTLLQERGRLDEAEAAFRQVLALRPQHADALTNLGRILLLTGRFDEGWPYYESRHGATNKKQSIGIPDLPFAQWKGEPLAGKSLIILPEGGYGDQIHFCRYISMLKAQGARRIDIICDAALAPLFETIDTVDAVILSTIKQKTLGVYDYWVFSMSLPLHSKTTLATIPAQIPYLRALPERVARWAERLPGSGLRVGLVWKGNKDHQYDAIRSLPGLHTLAPLWSIPGITFVSLQKGAAEDEAAAPPDGQPLLHLGSAIEDFADSAAILSQLDLLICVDTAIAHLAGALGTPCWVLLPAIGLDWRWLLERTDSPWYPGMRLFRQTTADDWAEVVTQVATSLRQHRAQSVS